MSSHAFCLRLTVCRFTCRCTGWRYFHTIGVLYLLSCRINVMALGPLTFTTSRATFTVGLRCTREKPFWTFYCFFNLWTTANAIAQLSCLRWWQSLNFSEVIVFIRRVAWLPNPRQSLPEVEETDNYPPRVRRCCADTQLEAVAWKDTSSLRSSCLPYRQKWFFTYVWTGKPTALILLWVSWRESRQWSRGTVGTVACLTRETRTNNNKLMMNIHKMCYYILKNTKRACDSLLHRR